MHSRKDHNQEEEAADPPGKLLLVSNSSSLSKSITLPDRFEVQLLSNDKSKSDHVIGQNSGDATLVKIEDESPNLHGDDEDAYQRRPWKEMAAANSEKERPTPLVHDANHLELTNLGAGKKPEVSVHPGRLSVDHSGSEEGSSDDYPGKSKSIVSKIRDILQRNMPSGLWDPLMMEHHSLFTQLNVLCHFRDGSVAWKETARLSLLANLPTSWSIPDRTLYKASFTFETHAERINTRTKRTTVATASSSSFTL